MWILGDRAGDFLSKNLLTHMSEHIGFVDFEVARSKNLLFLL